MTTTKVDMQYGHLKMAENLIRQRVESTLKATAEAEKLRLEDVRRRIEKEMGLEKQTKLVTLLGEKVTAKVAAIAEDIKKKREMVELDYSKKIAALDEDSKDRKAKVQIELDAEKGKLENLKTAINQKADEEGAEIKEKAAGIRAHLSQEQARLNDSIYATVLPENLRAVVDEAPRIGQESKFLAIEFK